MTAICIPAAIPPELNAIDDELKAIYHSANNICIWVFASREERNRFVDRTLGMSKAERERVYAQEFASP